MNDLPDRIQLNIYERLSLSNRNKLRLTCKKINNLIDQIKINDLFFCGSAETIYNSSNAWFYSNELIDRRIKIHNYDGEMNELIYSRNLLILQKNSIQSTLRRLKIAFDLDCNRFNLNVFEQFNILEQLEFNLYNNSNILYRNSIKLNQLRNVWLLINSCITFNNQQNLIDSCITFNDQQNLINILIDSPNLVNCYFGCNVINSVKLVQTNSVEYLEYSDNYNAISLNFHQANLNLMNLDTLRQFTNVEILKYNSMLNFNVIHLLTPIDLLNLREIHFTINGLVVKDIQTLDSNSCHRIVDLFSSIQNMKKQLLELTKRSNLRFYIQGVQIHDDTSFDDYAFFIHSIYGVHAKNLANLQLNFPNIRYLDYDSFLNSISIVNLFPSTQIQIDALEFNIKYCNLKQIDISQPVNQHDFMQFISKCNKLNHINLTRSEFNQHFFDQLSTFQFDLYFLEYRSEPFAINIDFLSKLEYLHYFITDQNLSNYQFINLIKKLKYFRKAVYRDSNDVMTINKLYPGCLNITWKPILTLL